MYLWELNEQRGMFLTKKKKLTCVKSPSGDRTLVVNFKSRQISLQDELTQTSMEKMFENFSELFDPKSGPSLEIKVQFRQRTYF